MLVIETRQFDTTFRSLAQDKEKVQGCDATMMSRTIMPVTKKRICFLQSMKRLITVVLLLVTVQQLHAQTLSEKMAETVMTIWKDSMQTDKDKPVKWAYDQGVVLKGIEGLWLRTGDKKYFDYIQKSMDFFVNDDGTIRTYKLLNYNIDNVLCGRNLLMLYNVLGKEKYYKAAATLRDQLRSHPRTKEGAFWHKEIYPWQMWLDGLYMAQPFYAEWSKTFHDDAAFTDIARQFILMERHSRDAKTGLLYHGYDESRKQQWADKTTGRSPHVWARAMGWYGMALVDVLENFPENNPHRDTLERILNRFATAVVKYQDKKTGLWYDIVDMAGKDKNYVEASASCMLVYALAKGVRLGSLSASKYLPAAKKGYAGIIKNFITTDNGQVNLHGTVSVSGLGGNPYRDGSYDYYISEKVVVNDPKGVGAFLLAGNEIEILPTRAIGKNKLVLLDNYFNHETRKDITGKTVPYHYVWDEMDNNGFSMLGEIFKQNGGKIATLAEAPVYENLSAASVYIIVDPDTEKESLQPNYMQPKDVKAIYNWVKEGGVLALLMNDSVNAEFEHFNTLAEKFGIHFNQDNKNRVKGTNFEEGAVLIPPNHSIFKNVKKAYIKELSTLKVTAPAKSVLKKDGDNLIAVAKVGHGFVFAVGDPWFYNEYIDGRKLPPEFQNYQAAQDFAKWLLTIKTNKYDIIPWR
jgi:unsaturated rhamnogalacturonyl hydrolase